MPWIRVVGAAAAFAAILSIGYLTRERWQGWLYEPVEANPEHALAAPAEAQQIKLSPQARKNLGIVARPLKVEDYWRTIQTPGAIIDRPGVSDRGVVAPVAGVVSKMHVLPGDIVRSGEVLFTMRVLSESLHLSQMELFKTAREIEIVVEQKKRLNAPEAVAVIPEARRIEVENQLQRLAAANAAYRQDLLSRGLRPEQIDDVTRGKFVSQVQVTAPLDVALTFPAFPLSRTKDDGSDVSFEVQELKIELGHQVQAGQTLCLLSNHQALFVEGYAFNTEAAQLANAARERWPIEVDFLENSNHGWPALDQKLHIRHIANTLDATSRTFAFYLPLSNQSKVQTEEGRTRLLWRFRPGQKVRLYVPVEKLTNVFVLPAAAVVRDGIEAYVFRQNGDLFERKPVHVLFEDSRHTVIANDGGIPPGLYVAQNAAAALNRALKAQAPTGLPPGFHVHPDGTVHGAH